VLQAINPKIRPNPRRKIILDFNLLRPLLPLRGFLQGEVM
jgi:hypothetical protein